MNRLRLLVAAIGCLFLGLASPAIAQTDPPSWLLKYISFYTNVGSHPPNIQEPTVIRLYGWFPYDYGHVGLASVDDPGHVRLTLRPRATIALDTTRTWATDFDLGYLPLGDDTLTVTRTFVDSAATDSITESASFSFPVIDLGTPPPPPPPPGPQPPNWIIPWVAYGFFDPSQPNEQQPTTAVLHGLFPYDCGQITDVTSDSAHVSFTMRPGPACTDTARTWEQRFPLGLLTRGYHLIHITRRLVSPDSDVVAEGDWGVQVWADPNTPPPPPPGPPNHPSVLIRCLSGWYTQGLATAHTPTTLVLWGWFPFYCGQVVNPAVTNSNDSIRVALTLRQGTVCGDTVVTWHQSFDLGILPAGEHPILITLNVEGDPGDLAVERDAVITINVDDRDVTASMPNPFVSDTHFRVNLQKSEHVEVGIYDLNGRKVRSLFNGPMASGANQLHWDGRRDDGSRAAIGIYFSRVAFSNRVVTRKLVMLPR